MSLLLNALKKAALDKQKREQQFSDSSLHEEITESKNQGTEENTAQLSPNERKEDKQQNGSYMEYDPEFMDMENSENGDNTEESSKDDKLFIENDEASWDDKLNQHEFDMDEIDPDLEFNDEEFEEREDITEQEENNHKTPENEKQGLQLQLAPAETSPESSVSDIDESLENSRPQSAIEENNASEKVTEVEEKPVKQEAYSPKSAELEGTIKKIDQQKNTAEESEKNNLDQKSALSIDGIKDSTSSESKAESESGSELEAERKQAVKQLLEHSEAAVKNSKQRRTILLSLLATLVTCVTGAFYYHIATIESTSSLTIAPPRNTNQSLGIIPFNTSEEFNLASSLETEISLLIEMDDLMRAEEKHKLDKAENSRRLEAANRDTQAKTPNFRKPTPQKPPRGKPSKTKATQQSEQKIIVSENTSVTSPFNQAISQGFSAWQSGEWKTAEEAYNKALVIDPNHRDAILGAAAVAAQLGQQQKALRLYQKRIERAPRDEFALAGIIGLGSSSANESMMESELNVLLQSYPQAAHLHFLKGTVHARRKQWKAAQSAFFEAWRLDYSRPDYVFNLAVAMDHLSLHSQALEFYSRAQELAAKHATNFSDLELQARIAELKFQLAQGD